MVIFDQDQESDKDKAATSKKVSQSRVVVRGTLYSGYESIKGIKHRNRPYSYSRYWTGTSLQVRLMRGVFSNANDINLFLMISPRLRIWPIVDKGIEKKND